MTTPSLCGHCGAPLVRGADACRYCGVGLDGAVAPRAADGADPEVVALLRRGDKIGAIKVQRQRTGQGLREALTSVEALEERLGLAAR